MSDLSAGEKRRLEKLFGMGSGYVLNFSDRTFSEFFEDIARLDIDQERYHEQGSSKAKRLRTFWRIDSNHLVGKVTEAMIQYGWEEKCLSGSDDPNLKDDCWKIAQRLKSDTPVAELDALSAINDEKDFEVVAQHVKEAIEKNQPEAALDRLHIFTVKFMRTLCEQHGIEVTREKALHSVFGEYVKRLKEEGHLEAQMTERILKSSISVFEAFNHVRNDKSLAHDNPILNYEEALLIFNHVAATIRFIKNLEVQIAPPPPAKKSVSWDDIEF